MKPICSFLILLGAGMSLQTNATANTTTTHVPLQQDVQNRNNEISTLIGCFPMCFPEMGKRGEVHGARNVLVPVQAIGKTENDGSIRAKWAQILPKYHRKGTKLRRGYATERRLIISQQHYDSLLQRHRDEIKPEKHGLRQQQYEERRRDAGDKSSQTSPALSKERRDGY